MHITPLGVTIVFMVTLIAVISAGLIAVATCWIDKSANRRDR